MSRVLVGLGLVIALVGCTSPNPRSCADGTCTDPSLPFCDVDGALGGTAGTCISVDCTPNTFQACRGDVAVTCNAQGTSYDLTSCQGACDDAAGGCAGCSTSVGCAAGMPYCDPSNHVCRTCVVDSECASNVCDLPTGECVAVEDIVYAAPQGSSSPNCGTSAAPCAFDAAFGRVDVARRFIKLAAGIYDVHDVLVAATTPIDVHGESATLSTAAGPTLTFTSNVHLTLRGLTIINIDETAVAVGSTGATTNASLDLDRVTLRVANILNFFGVALTVTRSTLSWAQSAAIRSIYLQANSTATLRSSVLERGQLDVSNAQFHVANCVFKNSGQSALHISNSNGGFNDVTFTTFINSPIDMNTAFPIVNMSNNIHFGAPAPFTNAVSGNSFVHHYSLMNPQAAAPAGSDHLLLNLDPKFVSIPAEDYHLLVNSPAIDAADPAATVADDFDGHVRPVGAARDLGAFEYK